MQCKRGGDVCVGHVGESEINLRMCLSTSFVISFGCELMMLMRCPTRGNMLEQTLLHNGLDQGNRHARNLGRNLWPFQNLKFANCVELRVLRPNCAIVSRMHVSHALVRHLVNLMHMLPWSQPTMGCHPWVQASLLKPSSRQ